MSEQRRVPGNVFPPARSFELTRPVLLKPKGADDAAGWPRHDPSCCSDAANSWVKNGLTSENSVSAASLAQRRPLSCATHWALGTFSTSVDYVFDAD